VGGWRETQLTRHLGVLRTVRVRVANEHRLPVVMELAVGDCDTGTTVGNVEETIVVVLSGRDNQS
jgi:hypothetical protein